MGLPDTKFHFDNPEMNKPVKVLDLVDKSGRVLIPNFYCYVMENENQVASVIEEVASYIEVGQGLVVRPTTRAEMFNEMNS